MKVHRYANNPIIKPEDVKPSQHGYEVIAVFNAGVARLKDEIILLLRVAERPINNRSDVYLSPIYDVDSNSLFIKEFDRNNSIYDFTDSRVISSPDSLFLTSISHIRAARSKDGVNFQIDDKPALFPQNEYEVFGIEDPRITLIDGIYYINYSAIAPIGVTTCLASTKDFITYERHGVIFGPDNKDVEIFPQRINGFYYAINRPSSGVFKKNDMWISQSIDLIHWGNHKFLMGSRDNFWDNARVGGSAVPFRIPEGWLEIYHGATKDHRYCLGAVLLDGDEPRKIISRTEEPIIEPEAEYETNGFFGNVIFSCGVLYEEGIVRVYYGASDTFTCYAEIKLEDILKAMKK